MADALTEWANWLAAHPIVYSASSDETIATFAQKTIAELTRIYELMGRLRQNDASVGTSLDDAVPYQFKINTLKDEILIRDSTGSNWISLGMVSKNFGITPAAIKALAIKNNVTSISAGNDADKPLAIDSVAGDLYISLDQKRTYRMGNVDWELILSLNVEDFLGYEKLITQSKVSETAGVGKIPIANSNGEINYNTTGNAAKIANKNIDVTDIADGRVLVYREGPNAFVFEAKGSAGSGGASEITDIAISTGTTYSSSKIEELLAKKTNVTGNLTAYNVSYDSLGEISTVTIDLVTYSVLRDALGRLDTISDGTTTTKALYNKHGQYLGMEEVK